MKRFSSASYLARPSAPGICGADQGISPTARAAGKPRLIAAPIAWSQNAMFAAVENSPPAR